MALPAVSINKQTRIIVNKLIELFAIKCAIIHTVPLPLKTDWLLQSFPPNRGILNQEVINTSGGRVFGGSFEVLIPAKVRGGAKETGQESTSKNRGCGAIRERAI